VRTFLLILVAILIVAVVVKNPVTSRDKFLEPTVEEPSPILDSQVSREISDEDGVAEASEANPLDVVPDDVKELVTDVVEEPESLPQRVVVQILHNRFVPEVVTVEPGTMVVWINKDNRVHKILTQDRSYISPRINPDGSDSSIFNVPGEYVYIDAMLNYMQGTVIVTGDADSFSAITGGVVFSVKKFFRTLFRKN